MEDWKELLESVSDIFVRKAYFVRGYMLPEESEIVEKEYDRRFGPFDPEPETQKSEVLISISKVDGSIVLDIGGMDENKAIKLLKEQINVLKAMK
ncbi:hypothetical protein D3C73_1290770 [compost metagenome]